MVYDIYFHNDFDGRAAAAIMLAFLRERGDNIEHFTPVDYDIIDQYMQEGFFLHHPLFKGKRNPAIVVDFPFHPKAAWWFDHHRSAFRKAAWAKKFKPTRQWHYDPEYASCCGQVAAILEKSFGWKPNSNLKELIKWGDILDGARYKSPRQTIEMKEPAFVLAIFMDREGNDPWSGKELVQLMSEKPMTQIAKIQRIRGVAEKARKEMKATIAYVKKNMATTGKTAYIYVPIDDMAKPRYIPYLLNPSLLYLVRVIKQKGYYKLSVGANPWRRADNGIDIGKLMGKYGGGGHTGVGATEFKKKNDAERAAKEIVDYLVANTPQAAKKRNGKKIKK